MGHPLPTGYEILLRAAGRADEVNIASFQEDFDFGKDANFTNIAEAITKWYPNVAFVRKQFESGKEKLKLLDERFKRELPTLISVPKAVQHLQTRNGPEEVLHCCHIVSIVEADAKSITVFWGMDTDDEPVKKTFTRKDLCRYHDKGFGRDIAFLDV